MVGEQQEALFDAQRICIFRWTRRFGIRSNLCKKLVNRHFRQSMISSESSRNGARTAIRAVLCSVSVLLAQLLPLPTQIGKQVPALPPIGFIVETIEYKVST
jgi:hypothetical protein